MKQVPDIEPASDAVDRELQAATVKVLGELLTMAEHGQLTSFVAVGEVDGQVRTFWPRPYRVVETVGLLRLAEATIIGDCAEYEDEHDLDS